MFEAVQKPLDEPGQGILEKTPGFLWATDRNLRLMLAAVQENPSPQERTPDDREGESQNNFSRWLDLIHADDLESVQAQVEAHLQGKADNICSEHRLLFPDGNVRWVLANAQAIRDRRGAPEQLVGTLTDITSRKNAEKLLRIERDLSVTLCSAGDFIEALRSVLNAVSEIDTIDCGGVYLSNSQTKNFKLVVQKSLPPDYAKAVSKLERDSPLGRTISAGKPVFSRLSRLMPGMEEVRRRSGLRACSILPLISDEEVVGAICVASFTHNELTQSTRNALEAIAAQVAGTIARMRAEEAMCQSGRRFRRGSDTTVDHNIDAALRRSHTRMEERVKRRTAKIESANERLRVEMAERKQAELALRVSEERFRAAFEEGPLGMLILGADGRCLRVNRALCRMLDRFHWQIVGKPLVGLGVSNNPQYNTDELARVIAGETSNFTWESSFKKGDGKTVWMRTTATAVHDRNDELVCGLGMVEDITKRRTAELALRRSEELFRLAFEEGPLGIWIIDKKGQCRRVNRAFAEMLGYSPEKLHGKTVLELTHPHDRSIQADYLRQLLQGSCRQYSLEKRYLNKDGLPVWTRLTATTVYDHDGMWLYGLGMVEDISQRKEAEDALRRVERLASIGTLAAGIAHEINNPLGAIVLSADAALLARVQPDGGEIVDASLRTIQAGALRCGRIVKSVLKFSHNEVSQKWLDDIGEVARRAKDMTKIMAADAGVAVRLELDRELPRIKLNPTEIEQVFVNLLTNAVQASAAEDRVTVRIKQLGNELRIDVEDTGIGMTEKQLERIFDPFYTTKQSTGGTGLGLSISHGIIQEHGGEIHVKSQPQTGTTMTVILPISKRGG